MATPVRMSPIFRIIPGAGLAPAAALNQIAKDQAVAQRAVAAYNASKGTPTAARMAGTSPKLNSIFQRVKPAGRFLGPALYAGDAALRLNAGQRPEQVAVGLGRDLGLSTLGAAIGTPFGGPVGAVIGSIAVPTAYDLAVGELKDVDMRNITPADAAQMGGTTAFGGLTTPTYAMPDIPDVTTPILGGIDWSRTQQVSERETSDRQPERGGSVPPATTRPVEERRSPVSSEVPQATTQSPQQARQKENELAQLYARQYRLGSAMAEGGELQRRLYEGGAAEGMPIKDFMSWVEAHPDLAYRLAEKRGLLPAAV